MTSCDWWKIKWNIKIGTEDLYTLCNAHAYYWPHNTPVSSNANQCPSVRCRPEEHDILRFEFHNINRHHTLTWER